MSEILTLPLRSLKSLKRFEDYNPIAVFVFFAGAILPAMFCLDIILLLISFAGGMSLLFSLKGKAAAKSLFLYLIVPIAGFIVNPLFYHNGKTVLFLINDTPITFESAFYGMSAGLMITAVLVWFRAFSLIMTSDRLLYIFGAASPKLALILSMTLRYIPLYTRQIKKIRMASKAMGLYREDTLIDRLRGSVRVFSAMVTWGLENGVITADSMSARGYGIGRRSRYAIFGWLAFDGLLIAASAILCAGVLVGAGFYAFGFEYYPEISAVPISAASCLCYAAYGILVFIPVFINIKEGLTWRSLQSET